MQNLLLSQPTYALLPPPLSAVLLLLAGLLLSAALLFGLSLQWSGRRAPLSGKREQGRRRLPPGSMGWPYLGETLKFYTENPNSFFSNRLKRYGNIFKTHILGCPCVMISSPKAAKTILVSQAELFKPTYPPSKEKMIGPQALFFHQGSYHSNLKKLILTSFSPAAIRPLVPQIEQILLNFLPSWCNNNSINALQQMKMYAFEVAMISVFGSEKELEVESIKQLYQTLDKGYNSMPLNIIGTPFYKAMKARKQLTETIKRLIEKRREKEHNGGGLLGALLRANNDESGNINSKDQRLSDSQIADNIIGVIFAAHDTTASVLTWLLKYLHDNLNVLEDVTVIQETLRRASILSFTFREAVEDVEFDGYFIPKGWKVLPLFRTIHHSPDFFPNPEIFDPSRFETSPSPNTFMPFGNGVHSCPGNELAKLEMLLLLHHLTTSYRYIVDLPRRISDEVSGKGI
nr:abscisic acid 8'-hydroxylase 2 [Ipomoea batatas]